MSTTPRGTVSTVRWIIALRERHGVREAHLFKVAPAQHVANDRRLDSGNLEHDVDLARRRALSTSPSPPMDRMRRPRVDAAFLQQDAARAIASRCPRRRSPCGCRRGPRACRLAAVRRTEYPHRLVVERAERNDRRLAIDFAQRLADAALDERDVDAAIAQEREVFGGASRLLKLRARRRTARDIRVYFSP
mgnify:CR=1 FL=1